jgi:hypothetical protein
VEVTALVDEDTLRQVLANCERLRTGETSEPGIVYGMVIAVRVTPDGAGELVAEVSQACAGGWVNDVLPLIPPKGDLQA